ncbi:IMP4 [Cordylochernes scorpioides]|uniref:IMP4 n=1 Tax=Cordylochernes scorpioides TaxID=51811 RepID=A0ABY6KI72_9ARAC|nr:IMP4 [Cordylochernes scorpioides]
MFKRQQRLRREFIYRKNIENRVKSIKEGKDAIRKALDEEHAIPTELQKDALKIQKSLKFDDEGGEGYTTSRDDEYKWASVADPKIFLTTSRDPSAKLKKFAKEIKLMVPNTLRLNRGNLTVKDIVGACTAQNFTDILILCETRGVPDGIIISHLPFGPTAYFSLSDVTMRHDIPDKDGHMPQAYPQLIFHNFTSTLGKRVQDILKYLFPVPKANSKRIVSFFNRNDVITFEHLRKDKFEGKYNLSTLGPRFNLRLYKLIQGTIDMEGTSDVEWVLRPYMNTAHKRKFLSED